MRQELINLIPTLPLIKNVEDINQSTRLEKDLRLSGLQAHNFLMRYSVAFNVEISQFPFRKYFMAENSWNRLFGKVFSRRKNILTLGDLEKAIEYGSLDENILKKIALSYPEKAPHKKLYLKSEIRYNTSELIFYIIIVITTAALLGVFALWV